MFIAVLKASAKAAQVRSEQRQAHDAYWEPKMNRIWLAGPLLDGDERKGQVMIVTATSKEEAHALISADPYVVNGAFEPFDVAGFRASVREGTAA
jgi:uncharacterized protein YciI